MDVYYQPKSGFSWADDDEDDTFDLDSFRVSTINTTPTLAELGPLQAPSIAEDNTYIPTYSSLEPIDAAVPWQSSEINKYVPKCKLPGDPHHYLSSSPANWPFQQPLASTFAHNTNYECTVPEAYPGLSSALDRRYNYAANWRDVKFRSGGLRMRRGETFMMRHTLMSFELVLEEDDKVPELTEEETDEEIEERSNGVLTPVNVLVGYGVVKKEEGMIKDKDCVAIADGEESNDSDTTLIEFASKTEEICTSGGFTTTPSPPPCTSLPPETCKTPPTARKDMSICSASGLLALGTGIVVGAVIGAVFFRRR